MTTTKELIQIREENNLRMISEGKCVRPARYKVSHPLKSAMNLEDGVKHVSVAGRVMARRVMGKITFLDLADIEGKLQICLTSKNIGEVIYNDIMKDIDIGDFIGVQGEMFTTKAGQKSLRVKEYTFLGKALRFLPEKYHGVTNQELIYRERHLDLIMNDETKKKFLLRSKFIKLMREFLDDNGFIEAETPAIQNTPSGATAKPFVAYHNAFEMDIFFRISPELTLKKLIVGGFTNVYEIARDFRNEGISVNHLQDFTMVEGYSAYWDYKDSMKFMKEMVVFILDRLYDGNLNVVIGEKEIDFGGEWKEISFRDLVMKDCGIDINDFTTAEALLKEIRNKKIDIEEDNISSLGRGNLIDLLYKKVSRPNIIDPTFLTQHPTDLSPLARSNDENQNISDRFQLVVNGQEIINGYSELVDPREQEKRLLEQNALKVSGDDEAMSIDYEYIKAMEFGMPPISGWGLGIDRFLQFLTNSYNIRDVVLYPLLKPKNEDKIEAKDF